MQSEREKFLFRYAHYRHPIGPFAFLRLSFLFAFLLSRPPHCYLCLQFFICKTSNQFYHFIFSTKTITIAYIVFFSFFFMLYSLHSITNLFIEASYDIFKTFITFNICVFYKLTRTVWWKVKQ